MRVIGVTGVQTCALPIVPAGNTASMPVVSVQVPTAGGTARAQSSAALADGAPSCRPLGEGSGATGFERKSVAQGKSVDLGGRRIIKQTNKAYNENVISEF